MMYVLFSIIVGISAYHLYLHLTEGVNNNQLNVKLGELQSQLSDSKVRLSQLEEEKLELTKKFEKLRHQKISADVKMGQKFEQIAPFMDNFPYKDDEIKGLFQPVDLVVFRENEIIFMEVKSGQSQLSDKQHRIKKLVEDGKVRFEVYRM